MAATVDSTQVAQTILAQCIVCLNQTAALLAQANAAQTGAQAAEAGAQAAETAAQTLLATAQVAPTSSSFPVNAVALCKQASGGAIADGDTVAGSDLTLQVVTSGAWASGGAQTGTWKNVSGASIANNDSGIFVRTM